MLFVFFLFFFFKQKTAYEIYQCDWSSDVCSSDLTRSRNARRAARKEGELDSTAFLKLADKFIDLANRENAQVKATQLHMAFLYAAARYNAYVAKSVGNVEDHEKFVQHMVKQYQEMLRQHLADESLDPPE